MRSFLSKHIPCKRVSKWLGTLLLIAPAIGSVANADDEWKIDSQAEWKSNTDTATGLDVADGMATPTGKTATFKSILKRFDTPKQASSIAIGQSPVWENWQPTEEIGPSNLGDAPVMLQIGPKNYWMFGRYGKLQGAKDFVAKDATLNGFDIPLKTTPAKNQFNAPGGLKKTQRGYHAWQSKDMKNWVHFGPITTAKSKWMTTAEYADGKAYFYYDFPNDQDPHLYIDDDLTDGVPGKSMGIAFKDPSDGSDCAIIRDLSGKFHLILEDWSPINASTHAWDSPLAMHAISDDGISNFKILAPPVDVRTKPTGEFKEYFHPHWHKDDPENFPAKVFTAEELIKNPKAAKTKRAVGKYEVHEPEQEAFGDWASISIGGQYYLFADYDPVGKNKKGKNSMSVAWFTASSIDGPFTFCGNVGKGHPDPDVMFAEGKFYLATQTPNDYVSPGPWVESVEARVGVDVDNDGSVDQWTDWQAVKEQYDYIKGFSKQVAKKPAQMDLSSLPKGYGFQFEIKATDTTDNKSKPILDKVVVDFK